jgi:hypothetical protein
LTGEFDVLFDENERVVEGLRYFGVFNSTRGGDDTWFCPAIVFPDGKIDWGSSHSSDSRYGKIDLHGAMIGGYPVRYEYLATVDMMAMTEQPTIGS